MGLKPSDYAMLAGMVGGPLLGGMFAQDPQERQSFEGKGASDPSYLMSKNQAMLDQIMPMIMGRANAGVSLPSAVVQQPGAYTGGGLPMPIGLVASDPALSNPNLLKLPGLSGLDGLTQPGVRPPYSGGPDDSTPDNPDYVDPDGYHDVDPPPGVPPRTAVPRPPARRRSDVRADPLFDDGALIDPGSDLQQALGSVDLLLQAYGGGNNARV